MWKCGPRRLWSWPGSHDLPHTNTQMMLLPLKLRFEINCRAAERRWGSSAERWKTSKAWRHQFPPSVLQLTCSQTDGALTSGQTCNVSLSITSTSAVRCSSSFMARSSSVLLSLRGNWFAVFYQRPVSLNQVSLRQAFGGETIAGKRSALHQGYGLIKSCSVSCKLVREDRWDALVSRLASLSGVPCTSSLWRLRTEASKQLFVLVSASFRITFVEKKRKKNPPNCGCLQEVWWQTPSRTVDWQATMGGIYVLVADFIWKYLIICSHEGWSAWKWWLYIKP